MTQAVQVFWYVEELDAFRVTDEFARLADTLGLTKWHPVVWVGRFFMLDNDVGEHWFDNWDERDERTEQATALGIDPFDLMIVAPGRMQDGRDGPCHSDTLRKAFWTDVLKSLRLSYDLLFAVARTYNDSYREHVPEAYVPDLEVRIERLRQEDAP